MGRRSKGDRVTCDRIADYKGQPRWQVTLWLDGERTRQTCYSEEEATRAARVLRAQLRRGALTAPRTWSEAEEMLRQSRIAEGTKESSYDSTYPSRFRAVHLTLEIDDPLALTADDAQTHKLLRLAEGKSHATINGELDAVTTLQRWAVSKGWLRRSTWEEATRLEAEPRDLHLSPYEVGPFLRAAATLSQRPPGEARPQDWWWWEAAAWVCLFGLRSHEATQLKVRDIDTQLGVIRVGLRKGFVVKSKRSKRLVPFGFSRRATIVLRQLVAGREPDDPAFPSRRGGHHSRNGHHFRRRCHATCSAAGVTDVHPHALRHSLATALAMDGSDMRSAGELLGHDPAVTEKVYAHTALGKQLAAAKAAGALLDRAVEGRPVLELLPGAGGEQEG